MTGDWAILAATCCGFGAFVALVFVLRELVEIRTLLDFLAQEKLDEEPVQ